jgi:hypothetical protein
MPEPAESADFLTRLGDVPVGAHVVHDGEVWSVWTTGPAGYGLWKAKDRDTSLLLPGDTRVLWLEGDRPRPLHECAGRDVWDEECSRLWRHEAGVRWRDEAGVSLSPGISKGLPLVWPIVVPPAAEPWWAAHDDVITFAGTGIALEAHRNVEQPWPDEDHLAQALADHLNATGWTPPEPEPERPNLQEFFDRYDDSVYASDLLDWMAEHGYRVVDVQALGDAIEWLHHVAESTGLAAVNPDHGRALLDALGVDRG